jgi:hypothetical protein
VTGGDITVHADDNEYAYTNLLLATAAILASGREVDGTSTSSPTVTASIGSNAIVTATKVALGTGDVLVEVQPSQAEADTLSQDYGGALIGEGGGAHSTTTVSPSVFAFVGAGTSVDAGDNFTLQAIYQKAGSAPSSKVFSVDGSLNTLTVDPKLALQDGTAVSYDPVGGPSALVVLASGNRPFSVSDQLSNLTFTPDATNGDTIKRSTGSWVTDGFVAGQTITVSGATDTNNGTFLIASVSDLVLTLATGGALTSDTYTGSVTVSTLSPFNKLSGLSFAGSTTGGTITRTTASGSWKTDGFVVGQTIVTSGTTGGVNDGTFMISGVTDTVLTLTGKTLTTENPDSNPVTFTTEQPLGGSAALSGLTFAPHSTGDTITAPTGSTVSFLLDGFAPGQQITVNGACQNIILCETAGPNGTPANGGTFTIASVTAHVLTLTATNELVSDPSDSNTVTIRTTQQYNVVLLQSGTIQFGDRFLGANVDPLNDTIVFPGNDNLQNGDVVYVCSPSDCSTGAAFTAMTPYIVKVICANSIYLQSGS